MTRDRHGGRRQAGTLAGILACLALVASSCTSALPPKAAPVSGPLGGQVTYIAVGGSESLGFDAADPARQGWPSIFYRNAFPPGATFYDLAEQGATTGSALSDQVPEAMALHPGVVTVWLGLSDLLSGEPVDTYQAQLAQVIHRLQEAGAARVLVANLPPLDQLPGYLLCVSSPSRCRPDLRHLPAPAAARALVRAYDAAVTSVASGHAVVVVNVHAALARALVAPSAQLPVSTDDLDLSTQGHALVAGLFASALAASGGPRATAPDKGTASKLALPVPRFAVGVMTEPFVDHTRSTPANNKAPALPSRSLPTLVLYPAKGPPEAADQLGAPPASRGTPFPLLVFAPGLAASAGAYEPLLRQWAAAGYVVASPSFPLSNEATAGGPTVTDLPQQPGDISFVIAQMLALSDGSALPLSHLIDPGRIALVGHSLGAVTALAVGYDTCCRDPRVKAVVSIAGTEAPIPHGTYFTGPPVPLLLIHGTADSTVAYASSQHIFAADRGPEFLLTLLSAPHIFPLVATQAEGPLPWEAVGARSVLDFLGYALDGSTSQLRQLSVDANVDGVASLQASPGSLQ